MGLVRPVGNFLQRITLRLFADYKVVGCENVPPSGPLIIVANHQSNFDPPLLGAIIPRRIWFLAKDAIFKGPIAYWFLRSYGAFPLNRDQADIRAFRWVLEQLEQGDAVVIFPEGTRSKGALQKAHPGVVRLALKAQAPLLPVGITGTERLGSVVASPQSHGKDKGQHRTGFLPPIHRGQAKHGGPGVDHRYDNAPDRRPAAGELPRGVQANPEICTHGHQHPLTRF